MNGRMVPRRIMVFVFRLCLLGIISFAQQNYINVVVCLLCVVCSTSFPSKSPAAAELSRAQQLLNIVVFRILTLRIFQLLFFNFLFFYFYIYFFANTNRHGLVAWQNFLSCAGLFLYISVYFYRILLLTQNVHYFKIEHGDGTFFLYFWDPYVTRVIHCKNGINLTKLKKTPIPP